MAQIKRMTRWVTVVAVLILVMTALPAAASNPNPGILPPNAHPGGASYGEWLARFIQGILEQPPSEPIPSCGMPDATGKAWFPGPGSGNIGMVLNCTVPAGKYFFYTPTSFAAEFYAPDQTDQEMSDLLNQYWQSSISGYALDIDGVPVENLDDYLVQSGPFYVTVGEDNVMGVPAGTYKLAAITAAVMVTPMSPGLHTQRIRVWRNGQLSFDLHANLMAVPGN